MLDTSQVQSFLPYVSLALSVGALFVSAFAYLDVRHARRADLAVSFLQEFRSEDFHTSLRVVGRLAKASKDGEAAPTVRMTDESELADHFRRVSFFFEYVGMLVLRDLLDGKLVYAQAGLNVLNCWEFLRPYIEEHRGRRDVNGFGKYQGHFEMLYRRFKTYKYRVVPQEIIARGGRER